ncbi:CoA transferase [Rhodococcus opacus]|nr:CoA transferase [Rhodococcus opacus]
MRTDALRVDGPLSHFRVLMVGESRVCRFAADILAGLGAQLVPDVDSEHPVLHTIERPSAARNAVFGPPGVDAVIVVASARQAAAAGLDGESCLQTNPRLVYAHIDEGEPQFAVTVDGHPETSTDALVAASFGAVLGFSDPGEPRPVELPISDFATALALALSVVASLVKAGTASASSVIQLSPPDASTLLTVDAITQAMVDGQDVSRVSRHRWGQLFVAECACGSGLTVQLSSSQAFWTRLAATLGRSDLTQLPQFLTYHDRVRNYSELSEIISAEMARRTAATWAEMLETADVPFAPFLTPAQALAHPQADALELNDPDCVPSGSSLLRPLRFDGRRPTARRRRSLT